MKMSGICYAPFTSSCPKKKKVDLGRVLSFLDYKEYSISVLRKLDPLPCTCTIIYKGVSKLCFLSVFIWLDLPVCILISVEVGF